MLKVFSLIGLADALYLSIERFRGQIPVCPIGGCETVLTSSYAEIGGIPISVFGLLFYLTIFCLSFFTTRRQIKLVLLLLTAAGITGSLILVYLQLYVIKSICIYCLISAAINLALFLTAIYLFSQTLPATTEPPPSVTPDSSTN